MKVFFWTLVAVVGGIFIYSKIAQRTGGKPLWGKNNPAPGTTYKDGMGATIFAGPDVDSKTGAFLEPNARPGTVEFSAQGN